MPSTMKKNNLRTAVQEKKLTLVAKSIWNSFNNLISIFCWNGIGVEWPILKVPVNLNKIL